MSMAPVAGRRAPTLRTKTGCFPCRRRRKKCDETRPVCKRCQASSTDCQWPTADDLLDRRYNAIRFNHSGSDEEITVCHASVATSHRLISKELEPLLVRHFIEKFYPLIHNPESQSAIHSAMVDQINRSVRKNKGARYSILANSASHLYFLENVTQMQERALQYYSKSLQGLADAVSRPNWTDDVEEILMAIILLYLHGMLGSGVYADVPYHLNAAIRIIKQQFLQDPDGGISLGPQRMAVESVVFSSFLYAMDVWTVPINPRFTIDHAFWLECEARLAKSMPDPTGEVAWNSPIMGTPFVLLKLLLSLKQLFSGGFNRSEEVQARLRGVLSPWIAWAIADEIPTEITISQDSTRLLILDAALLLDHLRLISTDNTSLVVPEVPGSHPTRPTAITKIVSILRRRENDKIWLRCHQGNWPVYTAGFFMREADEIELVRKELQQRWDMSHAALVDRLRLNVEQTWKKRGLTREVVGAKTLSRKLMEVRSGRVDLPI